MALLSFLLVLLLSYQMTPSARADCSANIFPKLSCGASYTTRPRCESAGCCWADNACTAPAVYGYSASSPSVENNGGITANLTLINSSGIFDSEDYMTLNVSAVQETYYRTHITISPPAERWSVPDFLIPRPGGTYVETAATTTTIEPSDPSDPSSAVEIKVTRTTSPHDVIFHMNSMLVYQDQYIQFVLQAPEGTLATYGFGESTRAKQALQYNASYTLWNTDTAAAGFDIDLYGSYPFYLQVMPDGLAQGVLFLSSNAIEAARWTDGGTQYLSVQAAGGDLDLYVFAGPDAASVVQQLQEVVGLPAMPPYWGLGFHNCRWGYPNVEYVVEVVNNYSAANIPLEVQWMDIDYMEAYKDFTLDPINFPQDQMKNFTDQLHANGQYFIPILDPAIYIKDENYTAYTEGMNENIFVQNLYGNQSYMSQVWPGPTYFPDWFAENTTSYWIRQLQDFYNLTAYDGLWIDMNEASNFCNLDGVGQVCVIPSDSACPNLAEQTTCCLECTTVDTTNKWDFPPYTPHTANGTLGYKAMTPSSLHAGNILEYNAHNLYGLMEAVATRKALTTIRPTKRPFILSRSTFLGSSTHTFHWTGDNAANWPNLQASIITMTSLSLFGAPMTGADICGFFDNTTEQLCTRWIEVGAFSPFSRDHNIRGALPQELYRWPAVAEASRVVLNLRYRLLPYLYTLMYRASSQGYTVMSTLWMNFPTDSVALGVDEQYMWSDGILFTPVIKENFTNVTGYFPAGLWYSAWDYLRVIDTRAGGERLVLETPLIDTNVHFRGGAIIPSAQLPALPIPAVTTSQAQDAPISLLVFLNDSSSAAGMLYLDDGEQIQLSQYSIVNYAVAGSKLTSVVSSASNYDVSNTLGSVVVTGPFSVTNIACSATLQYDGATDSVSLPVGITVTTADPSSRSGSSSSSSSSSTFTMLNISLEEFDVNILSNFELSWAACTSTDPPPSSPGSNSGFDSIPLVGKVFIFISVGLVVIGCAIGGFYYVNHHKDDMKKNLNEDIPNSQGV